MNPYSIVRTNEEIDEMLNRCAEAEDGSEYPGMTFEQGIEYATKWLTDKDAEYPFE